jgi:hypothetical protein
MKVVDPSTGKVLDWELFKDPGTQKITGVYIKSEGQPIKQGNFPIDLLPADFEGKKKYSDWVFIYNHFPTPDAGGSVTGLKSSHPSGNNDSTSGNSGSTSGNSGSTSGNSGSAPGNSGTTQ